MRISRTPWNGKLVEPVHSRPDGTYDLPERLPTGYCWHVFRRQVWETDRSLSPFLAERRIKVLAGPNGTTGKLRAGWRLERMVVADNRLRWLADYAAWLDRGPRHMASAYRNLAWRLEYGDMASRARLRHLYKRKNGRRWRHIANWGCRVWNWSRREWEPVTTELVRGLLRARENGWPLRDGLSLDQIAAIAGAQYENAKMVASPIADPKRKPVPKCPEVPDNAPRDWLRFWNVPMLRVDVDWS